MKEFTVKKIIKYFIISLLFFPVSLAAMSFIYIPLAYVGYPLLITFFTTYEIYSNGIKWDLKIYKKAPKFLNHLIRLIIFLGGIGLSLFIIYYSFRLITDEIQMPLLFIGFALTGYALVLILLFSVIFLAIIGFLKLIVGKLNSWIGMLCFWIAIYVFYNLLKFNLMLNYYYGSSGNILPSTFSFRILTLLLDFLVMIYTTSSLIGKNVEVFEKKHKRLNSSTILIFLFFSKSVLLFSEAQISFYPEDYATEFQILYDSIDLAYSMFFFAFLAILLGITGIKKHAKLKKELKKGKSVDEVLEANGTIKPTQEVDTMAQHPLISYTSKQVERKNGIKFCPNCGAQNDRKHVFCKDCGADIR